MQKEPNLYEILEKASIPTKIGVEIQTWIEDHFEKRQESALVHYHETKYLPQNVHFFAHLGKNAQWVIVCGNL